MKLTKEYLRKLIREAIGKTYHTGPEVTGVYFSPQEKRVYVVENGKEIDVDTGGAKDDNTLRNLARGLALKKGYSFIEEKD